MKSNFKKILLLIGLSILPVNYYAMEADESEIEPADSELPQSSNLMELADELIVSINSYLIPSPDQFPGEILEKLEGTIIFFSSSKQLKNILENEVIEAIRSKIDQYEAIQNSKKENLLQLAIQGKRYNIAPLLIKAGFSLDSLTTDNLKVLCSWAISNGYIDLAKITYASIYQKPHKKNKHPRKTLKFSPAQKRTKDMVALLTNKPARPTNKRNNNKKKHKSPNKQDNQWRKTLLHQASKNSTQACVKLLLDNGAEVDSLDDNGNTPLAWAARRGNLEIVKLLVENKANVNHQNMKCEYNLGPLFYAIIENHTEVVKFLLNNNADINIRSSWGLTPLTCAKIASRGCSHNEILSILLSYGAMDDNFDDLDKDKALFFAIQIEHDSIESIDLLLSEGASLEARSKIEGTPLIYAIMCNSLNIAEYLINQGADINAKTNIGCTALSTAISGQNIKACVLLIQHGAKINDCTNDGIPIIFNCINYLNEEMIAFLFAHGLEANYAPKETYFDSLLIMVIDNSKLTIENKYRVAKVLIKNGADVNYTRPTDKITPLILSVLRNNLLITRLLIKNGANIHHAANEKTALELAIEKKSTETIDLLTEANNKRDKKK